MSLLGLGQGLVCALNVWLIRLLRVKKMGFLSIFDISKIFLCTAAILADPRFLGVIPDEQGLFLEFLWGYTDFVVKSIFFI